MAGFTLPTYILEYTPKTIESILSQLALEGQVVEIDVYERNDVSKKLVASGQRQKGDGDVFLVSIAKGEELLKEEWNYTIIRESAGRSRKATR